MVIDELVVKLGLDPKNFTQGQREALASFKRTKEEATATAKDVEAQGKRITDFFGTLKRQAIGLVAGFFGGRGVKEFVSFITTADAATGRLAHTLNQTTEATSAWQNVGRQTGGTAESMAGSMANLSGQVQHFLDTGEGSFLPILNSMEISLKKANGQVKTAAELFDELAGAAEKLDPARAASRLRGLGLDPASINTLLLGQKRVRELVEEQKRLGTATKESSARATELQTAWAQLETRAEGLGRSIYEKLGPAMSAGLKILGGALGGAGDLATLLFGTPEEIAAMKKRNLADAAKNKPAKGPVTGPQDPTGPLRYKFGANAAGASHAGIGALAHDLQSEVAGLDRFTAFNDLYHHFLGANSSHTKGLALDFTVKDKSKSAEIAAAIRAKLAARGIDAKVIDEYTNPSKGSTGGHIHVQFGSADAAAKYAGAKAGAPFAAAVSADGKSSTATSTTTSTTTIGSIHVNAPKATDAEGVAGGIRGALTRTPIADQANAGLQ